MADLKPRKIARYGWRPDLPDARDEYLHIPLYQRVALPPVVDLRSLMPPVYDQGDLGSCTGNAVAGAVQYQRRQQKQTPDFVPSRLFIYWNERDIEHTVNDDAGAQIRDGIKVVAELGVCPETDWPYDPAKFRDKPSPQCYDDAKQDIVNKYMRVPQTLRYLRAALAQNYAVVFGFTVYDFFEDDDVAATGVVRMPTPKDVVVGGHAVVLVGYNDQNKVFVVRNSWGTGWGVGGTGYFYLPYDYVVDPDLADDFWAIEVVS